MIYFHVTHWPNLKHLKEVLLISYRLTNSIFKNTGFSFSRETLKVLTLDFCVKYYMPLRHSFRLLPDDVRELFFSNVVDFTCILTFRRQM